MFAMQHRLNTRQRNSVLKLKVATNCPDWDTRIGIIKACSEEVIADHEHGGGRAHWEILEDLGTRIGLKRSEIRAATPIPTTQLAWVAWEGLMANRHWLEGIIANTCAERTNVPGYGTGIMKRHGWFGLERERWASSSACRRRARILRAAREGRHRALGRGLASSRTLREAVAYGRRGGRCLREEPPGMGAVPERDRRGG